MTRLPEETSIGAVPLRAARASRLANRVMSSTSPMMRAAMTGPMPNTSVWEAPRFPDSFFDVNLCCELPVLVLVVDFLRCPVPERGVEPDPIIAKLDVPRNIFHCPFPCRIRGTVNPLDFQ